MPRVPTTTPASTERFNTKNAVIPAAAAASLTSSGTPASAPGANTTILATTPVRIAVATARTQTISSAPSSIPCEATTPSMRQISFGRNPATMRIK